MQEIKGCEMPAAAALAFLGDAVHAIFVREMLVARGLAKSGPLNEAALGYVTAEAQARQVTRVLPHFTEQEADLYRRAYNSSHLNRPKHARGAEYRAATGWEAVLGALWHLGEKDRARALFALATEEITDKDGQQNDTEN